jgi:hypothetical protein
MATGPLANTESARALRQGLAGRMARMADEGKTTAPATLTAAHEKELQGLAAEMLAEWQAGAWGPRSAENYARFCAWLAVEIATPGQAPPTLPNA